MFRFIRWAVLIGAALWAGFTFWPRFRLATLVALGRSPDCPFGRALEANDELANQVRIKDQLVAESNIMEDDKRGFHRWHTPEGDLWIPAASDYTLHFNLAEQKRRIYGTGAQAVKPGDIVLDCGANVGLFTLAALKAGARRVIAIEPAPENLECLRRNLGGEIDSDKVIVVPKGVWDKEDTLTLFVDPRNSAADSFVLHPAGSEGKTQVPLTTIDKIVRDLNLDQVDFIKMDIEGAEVNALRGAVETLKRFKPRVSVSVYHTPEHPRQVPQTVRGARPDYILECGPCAEANNGVRPDILWFR